MKPYYNQNETIFDVTERFPETIEVFVRFGFEHMTNDAMRQSLGKSITISQALQMKQIDLQEFEESMFNAIAPTKKEIKVSIRGVLPCPIRIPLLEGFEHWLEEQTDEVTDGLDYQLQAASMGIDWIKEQMKQSDDPGFLSDLFISAGFDLFFDKEQIGKYREQGVFRDMVSYKSYNRDFDKDTIKLRDPLGQYSMLGVVPAVFLVNQDELNGREMPRSWEDILKPEFARSVSLPIGDFDLFNAILLHLHQKYGEEGIQKLGRSLLQGMHPSEMVKSHTKKVNRPVVTIMPYFFTKMTKNGGPMVAVWPEDGAIISPIFMLAKEASRERLAPYIDFFSSREVGEILSHQGLFPSVHPMVDNQIEEEKSYMWLGWDYIKSHDMGALIKQLEQIFDESAKEKIA